MSKAQGHSGVQAAVDNSIAVATELRLAWIRSLSLLSVVFGLALIAVLIVALVASFAILPPESAEFAIGTIINISAGASTGDIGYLLEEAGIIRDQRAFALTSRLLGLDQRLQAGDYLLSPGMDLLQVIDQLKSGRVTPIRVTIPEGLTAAAIAKRLSSSNLVDEERFLELVQDETLIYGSNSPIEKPIPGLEGYLFPDTYFFVRDLSEEDIIKHMVQRFTEVAEELTSAMSIPDGYTLHDIVTLSSIIEKEVMVKREAPLVSAVFWNRLNIGMPLQSDPTVHYVMGAARKLYYSDLEMDSPYNTYRYRGLPPGPIASPGKAALEAALDPSDVDYLYFVAKGDGTHAFSKTFAQHRQARSRYGI